MTAPPPAAQAPRSASAPPPVPALPAVALLNWRDRGHPEGGGSEQYVERIATGLRALGHPVTVFCAQHPGARREEVRDGVRWVRIGGRFTVYPQAAAALLRGRLGRPEVVVDVQNGVPFCSPLVTRRPVVNVVHHVHREQWPVVFGPVVARVGWWLESVLAPRVYRRSRYVVVSEVTRREVVELGVDDARVQVVHNGADPALPPLGGREPAPLVCVLGRLVPHKRVELAMASVAALRDELPGLRLAVVGQGWWAPELEVAAQRLGVEDVVDFHGFVDEDAKHDLLGRAWVLAQPSLKEGWGLSVIEAAAHGTPTVAFAEAGGLAESVRDGETGLLVHSQEEFTDALRRLLTDVRLRERLGWHARGHAADYTWDAAVEAFSLLVRQLAASPARGGRERARRRPRAQGAGASSGGPVRGGQRSP